MREWVVNASPLIALGRLDRLDLLEAVCEQLLIPAAVAREVAAAPAEDAAKAWTSGEGLRWVQDERPVHPMVAGWDLGAGEAEVLSWAFENRTRGAVLDDLAARRCADVLGIPVLGTLGVMVLAKRRGMLAAIEPLLEGLLQGGFRLDPKLVEHAKRLAGE